jgi:ribonuclease HI
MANVRTFVKNVKPYCREHGLLEGYNKDNLTYFCKVCEVATTSEEIQKNCYCTGNPGPGGWGAVLLFEQCKGRWRKLEISGGYRHTTNNRMELTAAMEALKRLKYPDCNVKLYSDSQYMIHAFNKCWIHKWVKNNWMNAKFQPIVNKDLWEELLFLHNKHDIEWACL